MLLLPAGIPAREGSFIMHNELTKQDLELMRQELQERRVNLRPKLLEAVKEAETIEVKPVQVDVERRVKKKRPTKKR